MRHAILTAISTLLLVAALVFLILATISVPIVSSLKLAASLSYTYGIFGYCNGPLCISASYPVLIGSLDQDETWFLGSNIRNTLAKIFIVAPIAAGFTFIAFVFTFLSLCVHSGALKILSLVFTVVAFIASALVAVIVVLVFHPHVQWLGWLLVAAAGCCLVAFPLLLFSITASDDVDDEDSDAGTHREQKYGDIPKMDTPASFVAGSYADIKQNQYGYGVDLSSSNGGFTYRGANTQPYGGQRRQDRADALTTSLLDSNPSEANDVTRPAAYTTTINSNINNSNNTAKPTGYTPAGPNPVTSSVAPSVAPSGAPSATPSQNAYNGLKIQDVPSTPIASNRHLAPNFVPSEGTASTVEPSTTPYPHKDRASSIYNLRNYGVFDHHPSVEGHQPFTDLPDTDELAERTSVALDLPLDSDGESDFTSVSQRPPNDKYTSPLLPVQPHQQQQQHPVQYQAYPPAQGQFGQRPPNQFPNQQAQNFQPGPNQGGYAQPVQYDNRYQPQYQQAGPPRPAVNRPTVSDNALNNNPDFAIGFAGRRKQMGRPVGAGQRPGVSGVGFTPRAAQRDGPYGNI